MVSRRRGARLLANMRLGDMAAAIDSSRYRREDERARMRDRQRQMQIGANAISQIVGGVNDYRSQEAKQARQAQQDARQRALDELAREQWEATHSLATSREERSQQAAADRQRGAALERVTPGLQARATEGLTDSEGAWAFDLGGNVDVQSGRESATDDMVTTLTGMGFSEAEAREIARGQLAGAEQQQQQTAASAAKAAREQEQDAELLALRRQKAEAEAALKAARTDTERARARKLNAEAAKALRAHGRGGGPGGGPSGRAAGDYSGVKSGTTRKWLADTDATIENFEMALAALEESGEDTGFLRKNVVDPLRRGAGAPNEAREKIGGLLAAGTSRYKKDMLGAAQTDAELRGLAPMLPDLDQEPEVLKLRIRNFVGALKRNRDAVMKGEGLQPAEAPTTESADPLGLTPEQKKRVQTMIRMYERVNDGHRPPDSAIQSMIERAKRHG